MSKSTTPSNCNRINQSEYSSCFTCYLAEEQFQNHSKQVQTFYSAPFTEMCWVIAAYYFQTFSYSTGSYCWSIDRGTVLPAPWKSSSTFPSLSPSGVMKAKTVMFLVRCEEYMLKLKTANHLLV